MAYVLSDANYRELVGVIKSYRQRLSNLERRTAGARRNYGGAKHGSLGIRFRNDTGTTVQAYGVVRITGGSTSDFLTVDLVDSTYRWLYLVNGPKPVANGKFGRGSFLGGETESPRRRRVAVTGATPAYGERWGPVSGSQLLGQHRPGFLILGGYNSTAGTVIAIQLPPGEVRVYNDTGSPIAASGSATVSVYGGSAGTTDTGLDVTLTNASSVSWSASKYGFATADAGGLIFGAPQQT